MFTWNQQPNIWWFKSKQLSTELSRENEALAAQALRITQQTSYIASLEVTQEQQMKMLIVRC